MRERLSRWARHPRMSRFVPVLAVLALATAASAVVIPNLFPFLDPTGLVATYNAAGAIDEANPFFQSLGTNGRTCATCHVAGDAFGLSVSTVQLRFAQTAGKDPLFAPVDGANCSNASVGNPADHSLLLKSGLIRIALVVPAASQFTITAVRDPYGCASVTDPVTGAQTVSVYRRPLPTTNLGFLSTVMFDGRETIQPLNNPATFADNLMTDLAHQAVDATLGHAQAAVAPTVAQQTAIVNFELGFSSGQIVDDRAGPLFIDGAAGGPINLSRQNYYPGINDSLGQDPTGQPFNPAGVFTIYGAWANSQPPFGGHGKEALFAARRKIAAGEALFNTRQFLISNVRGLNDNKALGPVPVPPFVGTCTTCHDTPNVGNHSLPLPLDIGTGHDLAHETDPLIANGVAQLGFPDLPVFQITGCPDPFAPSGAPPAPFVIYTTDPGKALISGNCGDVGRTKGPVLRGLAARAPYFHNGAAQNLRQLVNFYNQRFQMNLTSDEMDELIAFLNSL